MSYSVANDILPTSLSKSEKHPRIQDSVSSLADISIPVNFPMSDSTIFRQLRRSRGGQSPISNRFIHVLRRLSQRESSRARRE
jgi:hypothetical protein